MQPVYIDLHIHTYPDANNRSTDYDVATLVRKIKEYNSDEPFLISFTDHNTINKEAYLSTTSRLGSGPTQWRTDSCGCSRSSVTRPTRMASSSARSLWLSICVKGVEICSARPQSSMNPLAVCAHFRII